MTFVTARLAPGQQITKTSFADLTSFAVRSVKWVGDGQVTVDFDDEPDDGGPMSADEVMAVKLRLGSDNPAEEVAKAALTDFDPTTADLPTVAAAVAALIQLANGESN